MESFFSEISPYTSAVMGAAGLMIAGFTSLFSVVNPLAAMPVYLTLTAGNTAAEKRQIAIKASIYMFCVLAIFLLFGTYILNFFGISLPGIRIAGGIVIMRAGFSMLNPEKGGRKLSKEDENAAQEKDDISFSPIAMPLLSGPGSIAVVIGLGSQAQGVTDYIITGMAIFLTALLAFAFMRAAPWLIKMIGKTGMTVMTRMMGFIALSIGVQFIINGIGRFYGLME